MHILVIKVFITGIVWLRSELLAMIMVMFMMMIMRRMIITMFMMMMTPSLQVCLGRGGMERGKYRGRVRSGNT